MTASSGQSAGQSHETSDRDLPTSSCKGSHLGLPGYLDHGRWQYRQDTFLGCGYDTAGMAGDLFRDGDAGPGPGWQWVRIDHMSDSGPILPAQIARRLKRAADGLVPAIVQDRNSRRVLMLAWMNDESLALTLATRQATYWSRSRGELWRKGATSGHTQYVHRLDIDCDGDALLLEVDQTGPACHTGVESCFDAGGELLGAEPIDPAAEDVQS